MNLDLPPEAFTRSTLQKAFSWLQEQPGEVRETIHTPERLVSLYQKSQRLKGREDVLRSEKFIHHLKKLTGHKDSETHPSSEKTPSDQKPKTHSETKPTGETPIQKEDPIPVEKNSDSELPGKTPTKTVGLDQTSNQNTRKNCDSNKKSANGNHLSEKGPELDPLSRERVNEVKKRFNLNSRSEALRILISLGFEKFSQL